MKVEADKNRQANFRGFYGEYDIVVTKPGGSKQTVQKHLKEKEFNQWKVVL